MARRVTERAEVLPGLAEVFRTHGYEGASLSAISAATGLGKGSLYHFFPGGKEEMAQAVLQQIDGWFQAEVFQPLRRAEPAAQGIRDTLAAVDRYFQSGRRVCLVGAFALGDSRDRFALQVKRYFADWVEALAHALRRSGRARAEAQALAEDTVASIQGALVLARAVDQRVLFTRSLQRLEQRLLN